MHLQIYAVTYLVLLNESAVEFEMFERFQTLITFDLNQINLNSYQLLNRLINSSSGSVYAMINS
jgi:hypothetical protein